MKEKPPPNFEDVDALDAGLVSDGPDANLEIDPEADLAVAELAEPGLSVDEGGIEES